MMCETEERPGLIPRPFFLPLFTNVVEEEFRELRQLRILRSSRGICTFESCCLQGGRGTKLGGRRKSTLPHTTALKQNKAANATCAARIGSTTPGKAGSVNSDSQPSVPEVSTKAPRSRSGPSISVTTPTTVKLANSSTHQPLPSRIRQPPTCCAGVGCPTNPSTMPNMVPSKLPSKPSNKPILNRWLPPSHSSRE